MSSDNIGAKTEIIFRILSLSLLIINQLTTKKKNLKLLVGVAATIFVTLSFQQ